MLFLFHHGDLVWKLVLAALVIATVALCWRALKWFRVWTVIPLAFGLWYELLIIIGGWILPPYEGPIDRISDRLIAASAFPEVRDRAIGRISEAPTTNDDEGLVVAAAQAALSGRCPDAPYARMSRFAEARLLARYCDHDTGAYDFALGEFARGEPSVSKALAQGDYATAMSLLPEKSICTRALFAHWAGSPTALADLDHETSQYCRVLSHVAHDTPLERGEFSTEMEALADELGLGMHYESRFASDRAGAWTLPATAGTVDTRRIRDLVLGLARADDLTTFGGAEVALRTGADLTGLAPDIETADVFEVAHGRVPADVGGYAEDCEIREAFTAALGGDGLPLANALRSCSPRWTSVDLVEAMLPRVHLHRAELARRLRMLRTQDAFERPTPFRLVDQYARYRDLAKLAGDTEDAARWQDLVDRFIPVLGDRRRAQALAIVTTK